jgi:hypothetical protein
MQFAAFCLLRSFDSGKLCCVLLVNVSRKMGSGGIQRLTGEQERRGG